MILKHILSTIPIKKAILAKPQTDTRDGELTIASRIGLSRPCVLVEELLKMSDEELKEYDCVIVDEAQFCNKKQCQFFLHLVDDLNIPVICYGLRADFRNELFEGSYYMLIYADKIEEIKTICWCGRKATMVARVVDDKIVKQGEQVVIGGNDMYVSLCRKHYNDGRLGENK